LRLKSVEVSWFRGAADSALLELSSRSAVVYGANGSGKSTFVDAIEYAIAGKVKHLTNEYCGKRQERAILNTHIPRDSQCKVALTFDKKSNIEIIVDKDGTSIVTADDHPIIEQLRSWKLEKVVIRQDEIAEFIELTKGKKYEEVIPLIGLEDSVVKLDRSDPIFSSQ